MSLANNPMWDSEDVTENPRFLGFRVRAEDGDYLTEHGWTSIKSEAVLYKTRDEARAEQKCVAVPTVRVPVLRPATIKDLETLDGDQYRQMSDRHRAKLHKLMGDMNVAEFFLFAAEYFGDESDRYFKKSVEASDRQTKQLHNEVSTRCGIVSKLLKPLADVIDMGDQL